MHRCTGLPIHVRVCLPPFLGVDMCIRVGLVMKLFLNQVSAFPGPCPSQRGIQQVSCKQCFFTGIHKGKTVGLFPGGPGCRGQLAALPHTRAVLFILSTMFILSTLVSQPNNSSLAAWLWRPTENTQKELWETRSCWFIPWGIVNKLVWGFSWPQFFNT